MKNEKKTKAFSLMSNAEYKLGEAVDNLKLAQESYKGELVSECIQNILNVQDSEGKLTERDLQIFINDLVRQVSSIKTR